MRWLRDDRGSAMVLTLVVAPLLLVALAGVLQLGALRVAAARVRAAADLATLVAVNDQDDVELARSGTLRLSANAAEVAREYFGRELELSSSLLAGRPAEIAGAADVAAYLSARHSTPGPARATTGRRCASRPTYPCERPSSGRWSCGR
jgi:Flp pilus assembly protein TadG